MPCMFITSMQEFTPLEGIKADRPFSVRLIFEDNHNWDVFCHLNNANIRDVERAEVQKMLTCKDGSRGFFVYYCENCNHTEIVYFGCNSRLCSNCGKNYTDKWSKSLRNAMFEVPHRHIVLSVSDMLWGFMKEQRDLLKVLMDSAIQAINDTYSHFLRKHVTAGAIVVLHPFSRDLSFKPHIHVLVTEGGFDKKGNFYPKKFIPARALRKTWQYQVLTRFKEALPKTLEISALIDYLFHKYDGFYAYLPKESRITSIRQITKYVGRYVRHPAIANTRISGYDGENVTFWYFDNKNQKHHRTLKIFEFIKSLIQHVPERQFKMIRYYGAYSRKWKRKYAHFLKQRSITQTTLAQFSQRWCPKCPECGSPMEFALYCKKAPPKVEHFGATIEDWFFICQNFNIQ